jgi:hypothetical protein
LLQQLDRRYSNGRTAFSARLSLYEPDTGKSGISSLGMRDRFIESFRVKSLTSESPQIIGSEPAGRPQNPQRLVIGLVLIRLFTSVQALASVRQIYQGNSHNSHPIFNLSSGSPLFRFQVMSGH